MLAKVTFVTYISFSKRFDSTFNHLTYAKSIYVQHEA